MSQSGNADEGSSEHLRQCHKMRRSADFVRCYRRGRKQHGRLVTLHVHGIGDPGHSAESRAHGRNPRAEPCARLGITASRKVGKAVVRHRLKRQVREIFRRWRRRAELPCLDVVVHLKPGAGDADFSILRSEVERLLTRLLPKPEPRRASLL